MTARDDLPDRIPADAGKVDPCDPYDCGEESSGKGGNSARREDHRTGGSGSETGEFALLRRTLDYAMAPHHIHVRCLRVYLAFSSIWSGVGVLLMF